MKIEKLEKAQVAREMEQLMGYGPFKRLLQLWAMRDEKIQNKHMLNPSQEGWDELRGFRTAIQEPEYWLRHLQQEKKKEEYIHPTGGD